MASEVHYIKPRNDEDKMLIECDGLQNETANAHSGAAESASDECPLNAVISVYGYGPTKNPFYEEARTVKAGPKGALLILGIPVSHGQKLLLINGAGQSPQEAEIVRTRTLGTQMFEVEIVFPTARPEFWGPFRGNAGGNANNKDAKKNNPAEKRRHPRMNLPRGMTIAWQAAARHDISRVASISLGGLFIETADPAPLDDTLQVQFDLPGAAVRARALVRRSIKGKGMGVEFTELPAAARASLDSLLRKLLGKVRGPKE